MSALNRALNESLALLEAGESSIEGCLAQYPEHADALRPLLETALELSQIPKAAASDEAFAEGKRRMLKAVAEKRQQTNALSPVHRWAKRAFPLLTGEVPPARRRALVLRWTPAAAAFLTLLIIGGLAWQTWLGTRVPQTATLYQLEGPIEIRSNSGAVWQPAPTGTQVRAGDQIRTGPSARATLIFFDGSITTLENNTEVAVVQLDVMRNNTDKVIILRQRLGETRSYVQVPANQVSHFVIKTPVAVTSAQGTEFALDVEDNGDTHLVVVEGKVSVTTKGSTTSVSAGEIESIPSARPLFDQSNLQIDRYITGQGAKTEQEA
jgi:mannose-6-phosphate isomerase-like protein (cupin superfamily)